MVNIVYKESKGKGTTTRRKPLLHRSLFMLDFYLSGHKHIQMQHTGMNNTTILSVAFTRSTIVIEPHWKLI